jgi:hypothetical protein
MTTDHKLNITMSVSQESKAPIIFTSLDEGTVSESVFELYGTEFRIPTKIVVKYSAYLKTLVNMNKNNDTIKLTVPLNMLTNEKKNYMKQIVDFLILHYNFEEKYYKEETEKILNKSEMIFTIGEESDKKSYIERELRYLDEIELVNKPLKSDKLSENCKYACDAEFIDQYSNIEELKILMSYANFLGIETLVNLVGAKLGSRIFGKPIEEAIRILNNGEENASEEKN